jgi:hypothetical protein
MFLHVLIGLFLPVGWGDDRGDEVQAASPSRWKCRGSGRYLTKYFRIEA